MRRTERLFALAEYLRGRRTGVTAEELADRFGVTIRTMYRDLDSLRNADLPLHAERGRGGGYALDRAYSLPPVNFTPREAAMLAIVGRWVTELRLVPFDATLGAALDKVRGALPAASQRELARLMASLSFVGVPARTAPAEVRRAVEDAWFERRPVRIRYQGARETTERLVEVTSIVLERTETLLNTVDLEKSEARQFKLHLIEHAALAPRSPPEPEPGRAAPPSRGVAAPTRAAPAPRRPPPARR
jgi:predicted DNA-binding transcriptional regulator YafY